MAADDSKTPEAEERDHSLASRAILAGTFGLIIGTKVGWIGTAIDAIMLARRNLVSSTGKIRATRNMMWNMFAEADWRKIAATFRYTLITSAVGVALGALAGWVRGDKIKNPKDIVRHPIQSLKLVLGITKNEPETPQPAPEAGTKTEPPAPEPKGNAAAPTDEKEQNWVNVIQNAAVVTAARGAGMI